jgi:glycosyltransferase involved in cell wall biosynthesis
MRKHYKTAIVHDLLLATGGADSTLESIYNVYPSPIYTLIANHDGIKNTVLNHKKITTSFIQRLPWGRKKYRFYLPFYPLAIEQFNFTDFDVILSSSFIVAKGALANAEQLHICYLHNPIRPAWELYHQFLANGNNGSGLKGLFTRLIFHYLRLWDITSANRVDYFIANSFYTASRIKKLYRRDAVVIYPPVNIDAFKLAEIKEDYYVTASRLVYHKRIDLLIEAFKSMPLKKLIIIGDGPELKKLKLKAPSNIEILGFQPEEVLIKYFQNAKAFLFAAHEDFGIAPIEAMACGTPVLAYGRGGCAETVIHGKTGLLFAEQTANSVINCVEIFESGNYYFDAQVISLHAGKFGKQRFEEQYRQFVDDKISSFFEPRSSDQ